MAHLQPEHELVLHANRWRVISPMLDAVDALTRLDGWLGALCLTLLTAFMIAGMATRILSRFLPWLPPDLPIAWEYSSYLMAATFTFGAAMTLRSGGHIRVRLILSRLAPQARRKAEILVSFIAFVFCVFFTYALFKFTSNSYELGEKSIASNTPVWIPQAFVTFGVLLMALQFLARVVRTLAGLAVELPAFEPDEVLSTIVLDKN
jgi:TRAP-type C4-dicarboxylate transport system permease small subunit